MGFFGFLGGALKAGVDGMNNMVTENLVEKAQEFRKKPSYELEQLIGSVDNNLMKRAIVLAIAMQGNPGRAVSLAQDHGMSKRSFENLLTHKVAGRVVQPMISLWRSDY